MSKEVYITKYALTKGLLLRKVCVSENHSTMVTEVNNQLATYHKPYWHDTIDEAVAHAEILRKNKIKSLEKQLDKVKKMNFVGKK